MSQSWAAGGTARAKWLLVAGLAWAAAGCAPSTAKPSAPATSQVASITATASEPAPLAVTATRLPIGTPTPQAEPRTATPAPSRTPRNYDLTLDAIAVASEPTATPSPTVTPTFDPTHAAPGSNGQCPAKDPALAPNVDYDYYTLVQSQGTC
jgi:hypothetical protein